MTPRILHLAGDWIDNFHETYCRVDSSQRADLELVSLRRGGIRLHGSVANMSKKFLSKIPSVHLLSGHASYIQLGKESLTRGL